MADQEKRLEQELRESQERLLKAQRVAHVGFLDWDLKTNEILFSDEACELTGYRPEGKFTTPDFVAHSVHPDDLAYVGENLEAAVKGIKPYDIVHRHLRPDGRVVWVHAQAELFRDASGAPVRLLGTIVDVTELKRVEQALRESELKHRTLFEAASDAILLMRLDRFIDCNARSLELFGCTREQIIGAPPYKYSPPTQPDGRSSREKALEKISRALTEGPQFFEWLHCREDGTPFAAEVSLNRLAVGNVVLVQAIVRDVSRRKQMELDLKQRTRELEKRNQEFERVTDAFVALDKTWHYTQVNARAGELFGRRPGDLLGKHIWTEFPEGVGQPFHLAYERAMAEQQPIRIEEYYAPWERWFENSIYPSPDGISIYFHDITARKRAEAARERFEEQLRQLSAHIEAAREEERTGIAREIHDQLGQSLTVLKMDLSWIARRAASTDGLPREDLLEKVRGLLQMSDEVIDEVRRISAELRPAILDQVGLGAALSWKAQELEKRTPIACAVHSGLTEDAKLDRGLASTVFRVFQEALTNVVRHANATRVDVRLDESEGFLVLEVRDDGRGITRDEIDDPRSLGLLGIRERVRHLGGTVAFDRGEPRGTVVTVRVPRGTA
jgi:PAS domain S-box-containing protein